MKKIIAVAALALAATTAIAAGNVGVEFERLNVKNGADTNAVSIVPSLKVAPNTTVDLKLQAERDSTGTNDTLVSARVRQDYALTNTVSGFARAGLGQVYTTGAHVNFYEVEPGLKVAVGNGIALTGSYRYRNALESNQFFRTGTVFVGGEYNVTKADAIEAKLFRVNGDIEGKGLQVGYVRSF
jgi:hypothetical protein